MPFFRKLFQNQNGLSLVDSLIGIIGISLITVSIITISQQSAQMSASVSNSDQSYQIARSVLEDIKSALLNYQSGDELKLVYKNTTTDANQSSLCKTYSVFTCSNSNQDLNLIEFSKVKKETSSSVCSTPPPELITGTIPATIDDQERLIGSQTLQLATKSAPASWFSVKVEAIMPAVNAKMKYDSNSTPLQLCKFIRKYKISVTPPSGSAQQTIFLEAYYPIPS